MNATRLAGPFAITAATALSVAGAILPVTQGGSLRLSFLYAASTGFILTAAAAGAFRWTLGRYLFAGLVCCWIGDVVGPHQFEAGAIAFAGAHIVFAAGFLHQGIRARRLPFALALSTLAACAVLLWLWPHLKAQQLSLVIGYCLLISAMLALALALPPDRRARLLASAAVVFFISDIFVARWQYVDHSHENALLCYPLYYIACLLFAWAAWHPAPEGTAA